MSNRLDIKFKGQSQNFELVEDGILAILNTTQHKLEYKIPFEEIKDETYTIRVKGDKNVALLYISFFFNIIFALCIFFEYYSYNLIYFYLIVLSLSLPLFLVFNEVNKGYEEKHIASSKILYFIKTKQNADQIELFIKSIFKHRNQFFKNKYLKIDPIIPTYVQEERILWLYTSKYITESEYEVFKDDLDRYTNFNPRI
ncbi:hypothetical protein [Flavobacterium algicola]|uniref:hypothetical protein n=1 Tax=Flavobacterium algicola TaxID=556529 RepID=UPI001EFDF3AC|nr:hypothetical protein [Flavobacterium algicola]MCG9792908.1 hypothetical protein [Flavobacterium algicola]